MGAGGSAQGGGQDGERGRPPDHHGDREVAGAGHGHHTGRGPDADRGRESDRGRSGSGARGLGRPSHLTPETVLGPGVIFKDGQIEQVWQFSGCCTADSLVNIGRKSVTQLENCQTCICLYLTSVARPW